MRAGGNSTVTVSSNAQDYAYSAFTVESIALGNLTTVTPVAVPVNGGFFLVRGHPFRISEFLGGEGVHEIRIF